MDLFSHIEPKRIPIALGASWLQGSALPYTEAIWQVLQQHLMAFTAQVMIPPMGYPMSVKTSSMGDWGWVCDARGYRYSAVDPHSKQGWPPIPPLLLQLAKASASLAGYAEFVPDTCLINVYTPNSKMGLHQDKDEQDFSQPIVSVSLGLPATFLFGGAKRSDKTLKIPLAHGDVVVWGGASRRYYHGVAPLKAGQHPLLGNQRINLTLRKAR